MTLAGITVYPCGSIDTNFDPLQFPLDSTFKHMRIKDVIRRLMSFCSRLVSKFAESAHVKLSFKNVIRITKKMRFRLITKMLKILE